MKEGYMISDAAKLVEVENHVLRYWEEELGLSIRRNDKKQRYYRPGDIKLLRTVKDLKEQGFQLKAIRMILPDLSQVERLDPQGVYKLREELNRQVQQEEVKASVTSLSEVRADYEKKQRTWQEKSFELELQKQDSSGSVKEKISAMPGREAGYNAQDRLHQFEEMLRNMIRTTMEEMSKESEERICQEVSVRLQKEMDYLLRQKEELQEKQVTLLKQILQEVKGEIPMKEQVPAAASEETPGIIRTKRNKSVKKEKGKKKKLFAKLV